MCLPVAVIVELIVGGERDQASPRGRQREKDLSGRVFPHLTEETLHIRPRKENQTFEGQLSENTSLPRSLHLSIHQFLPLWCDEVEDTVSGPREGHASDQENHQNHVGKSGCEIHHLSKEVAGKSKTDSKTVQYTGYRKSVRTVVQQI